MKRNLHVLLLLLAIGIYSCNPARHTVAAKDDGKIDITFVQVNDVYEIAPLENGKVGGMARVATLKKEQLRKNQNTFLVLSGDFLSPSVYNSLKYEGSRIRGKQMVEAMNAAGMDLVVFGNHEFDIAEAELQSRINESTFKWISTNSFHKNDNVISAFIKNKTSGAEPFPETYILSVKDADGTEARIGFIGLTLPFNTAAYVSYTDMLTSAQKAYDRIKDSCDAVVAITHQLMEDDIKLARQIPGLTLIMGGHEHERHYAKIGNVYITKADANARSAYIIDISINKKNKEQVVNTELKMVDEKTALDSTTNTVVKKWMDIAENNYASIGFDAHKIVMQRGDPLDGREAYIRVQPTNFTRLIVSGMEKASPTADAVIINSGSIRVDDILQMPVTQYDIIRSLPFGGSIMEVDMKGSLLVQILEASKKNTGIGGFLQYSPVITYDTTNRNWDFKTMPIDENKVYKIAITDFLMSGSEANMGFLTKDNQGIVKVYPLFTDMKDPRSDVRRTIINYMEGLGQ
jgi:2',3'-cyclic-nucleotide 2'-phosphodiesterase (5'-nucleotidase family)